MLKRHLLILTALIACGAVAGAQVPATLWTRTFGGTNIDVGHAVEQTADGGFIIAGYTRSYGTASGRNVLLIRTTTSGDTLWIRGYGGDADDEGYAVCQTADGGFVVAGYTKSFGAGLKDMYLLKADSSGAMIWSRVFGGTSDDEAYGLATAPDGGFVLGGVTSSSGAGSRDVWLVRTDAQGMERWRKTLGGTASDGAWDIQRTLDGGYIVTGWTFSYGPAAVGNAWLVKTDTAGNQVWQRAFGGTDADRGLAVAPSADGGYVFTGYTASSGAGLDDMYLVKTDSAGNGGWSRTFGGSGRDYGNDVRATSDGGYIVAGYTLSFGAGGDDMWLVKTDAQGIETWSTTLGGSASDVAHSVRQLADGGYIVTGHTLSFGAGVHDVWLIRLASDVTVVEGGETAPEEYQLFQNYPNPFNPSTVIGFSVGERVSVSLRVYDLLGRLVATVFEGEAERGSYEVRFDASGLAAGAYACRMTAGGRTAVRRMLLLR